MTSTYVVTIKQTGTESGTNRAIYTVDTLCGTRVCDTLSWFSLESARNYAATMASNYACEVVDSTIEAPMVDRKCWLCCCKLASVPADSPKAKAEALCWLCKQEVKIKQQSFNSRA